MRIAIASLVLALVATASAADVNEITNYRQYSDSFASSGQPDEAQLQAIKAAGFDRVVYIAWTDHEKSLPNEDRLVRALGMEYLHIPVEWDKPTKSDFYMFAGAMQMAPAHKTLLHCQVNARASAFSFLYRVIFEDVSVAEAKRDMNSVWAPNETWRKLIFDVLSDRGISPDCADCDWSTETE